MPEDYGHQTDVCFTNGISGNCGPECPGYLTPGLACFVGQRGTDPKPGDTCPHCGGEIVEDHGKWIVVKCGECGEVFSELDYPGADRDEQMVRI